MGEGKIERSSAALLPEMRTTTVPADLAAIASGNPSQELGAERHGLSQRPGRVKSRTGGIDCELQKAAACNQVLVLVMDRISSATCSSRSGRTTAQQSAAISQGEMNSAKA